MLLAIGLSACGAPAQTAGDVSAASQEAVIAMAEPINDLPKPQPSPQPPEPLDPSAPAASAPAAIVTPAPTANAAGAEAWQSYRNQAAGYAVSYPASWTVAETAGADGSFVAAFRSTTAAIGIDILVQPAAPEAAETGDLPNTRCEPITVAGLPAQRCLDTINASLSATLVAQGKRYTITSAGKQHEGSFYQRFLDSFTIAP
jgi:hypothetical protein